MFDALQIFSVTALCFTLMLMIAGKLYDRWKADDARERRLLHGRIYRMVNGEVIVFQENGHPLMNLSAYFDELPVTHRMGVSV